MELSLKPQSVLSMRQNYSCDCREPHRPRLEQHVQAQGGIQRGIAREKLDSPGLDDGKAENVQVGSGLRIE